MGKMEKNIKTKNAFDHHQHAQADDIKGSYSHMQHLKLKLQLSSRICLSEQQQKAD